MKTMIVGLSVPVNDSKGEIRIREAEKKSDIVVGQNIPSSELGLRETQQDSKTTAPDHPPNQIDKACWVTMAKKTTTNTTSSAPATSAKAVSAAAKSNAEMRIAAKTETTGSEFGKLVKKVEELEKKLAGKGYG